MGGNGRTGLYLLFIHPLYYGREWTDWVILTVHPSTVLWEKMDGLGYTYCSSIHCTMGENGRTGLYLLFIHPLYYGREWTDWVILTVHPSTVLWERMDGLGYTYCSSIHCTMGENGRTGLYLLFIHPLYYGREWTDWVILTVHPSTVLWERMDGLGYTYCSSIHCTMGENGRTGLYLLFIHPLYYGREWTDWVILTVHPSTVLWERMDGLGYTYCSSIHCTMGENGRTGLYLLFIHPLYYGREWVCLWCFNVQLGDLGSLRLDELLGQNPAAMEQ